MAFFRITIVRFQCLIIFILVSVLVNHYLYESDCRKLGFFTSANLRKFETLRPFNQNSSTESHRVITESEIRYFSVALSASRLANNIFEMCSLYGISRYINRKPIIYVKDDRYIDIVENMRTIMPELMKKFELRKEENLTNVPRIDFNMKCCVFDNPERLRSYQDKHIHLNGTFFQSYKYFDSYREEIRSFLEVSKGGNFSQLPVSDSNNFILCIHSRRTDFLDGQHHASNREFIISARDYIKARENQPTMTTVLMGDDYMFKKNIFPNQTNIFVSIDSPYNDLIYSRLHCDATLITAPSSTFGWWLGYLSRGERVYYLDIKTTRDFIYKSGQMNPDDFYDPRWSALNFDDSSKTVSLSL